MTDAVKLPPMPDPVRTALGPMKLYAEFQVRAYAIQAVMEERERCARVAASYATCGCNGKHGRCTEDDGPLSIAAAIRAQPEVS